MLSKLTLQPLRPSLQQASRITTVITFVLNHLHLRAHVHWRYREAFRKVLRTTKNLVLLEYYKLVIIKFAKLQHNYPHLSSFYATLSLPFFYLFSFALQRYFISSFAL